MATNDSLIQVKNLKKHYHRGAIKALDGVTADINKGDVMVVIGHPVPVNPHFFAV